MKFFLIVVLLIFINSSRVVGYNYDQDNLYSSLIDMVYKKYRTSGLLLLQTVDYNSFADLTSAHNMVTKIASKYVYSVFVSFPNFEERFKAYHQVPLRPLVAVLIDDMVDMKKFRAIAGKLNMAYPVWFLIFTGSNDNESCEVCQNPVGNPFNLKLNSRFLVFCCNATVIEEWWSKDRLITSRKPYGRLEAGRSRIKWLSKKSTIARRAELGSELSVVIVNGSSAISEHNGVFQGFMGDLLVDLMHNLKTKISVLTKTDSLGIYDNKTKSWTGAIGMIHRREADIAVDVFAMTIERLDAIEYTTPISYGQSNLYIKRPDGATLQWDAYFKAFDMSIWKAIISMILTVPLLLTFIKYYREKSRIWPLLLEHYFSVWGVYCQQGLPEFPQQTPLKIIYVSLFLTALVVSTAYSASLISFLAVSSVYSPFESPEGFVEDGSYGLIVVKGSSHYQMFRDSNDTLIRQMWSLLEPDDTLPQSAIEAFHRVCEEKVAFYSNEVIRRMISQHIPCPILTIDMRTMETLGMILPRKSVYQKIINYHLYRFQDAGYFRILSEKYMKSQEPVTIAGPGVPLGSVAPLFLVLLFGIIISLIALLVERARREVDYIPQEHLIIENETLSRIQRKIHRIARKRRIGRIARFYIK